MKKREIPVAAVAEILLLAGFAAFFIYAVASGTASLYVHPRVHPFLIFAAAVMLLAAAAMVRKLFRTGIKNAGAGGLVFFILTLAIALLIPAKAVSSGSGSLSLENAGASAQTDAASAGSDSSSGQNDGSGLTLTDGVLIFTDDNFYKYLNTLFIDYKRYIGDRVELVGFVYRENGFEDNEFVAARMLMTCCAADMSTVGLLCRYDGAYNLQKNAWVRVSGTIGETEYAGEKIPCIDADSVATTDQPASAYIYPY